MFKFKKIINKQGKVFMRRLSFYLKNGSTIKLHIITEDDSDEPHDHPWDFESFLIIPYIERIFFSKNKGGQEFSFISPKKHLPFTTIKRGMDMRHKTELYRFLGFKIPAITIGFYGPKKKLCSLCTELGYCKESKKLKHV